MRILPQAIEHPGLLPLLLVALLPLLLHILDRRRARTVDWPAMRLLVIGSRARVRRMKLREAMLLAVRSIAALLLAYAVLQPSSRELRSAPADAPGIRAVALAVDATPSMGYRETPGGPTSLEKAKAAALRILDGLAPGSPVVLLGAGPLDDDDDDDPAPLDIDAARRELRALGPMAHDFRIMDALEAGARALGRLSAPAREVHILTDLQASVLAGAGADRLRLAADRLQSLRPPPAVRLVDCGARAPWNRFVSALEPEGLAAVAGDPVTLRATVELSGPPPEGAADLHLVTPEGAGAGSALPALPATVSLSHPFSRAGETAVSARLPSDGLVEDDEHHAVIEVLDRIRVLITGAGMEQGGSGPGTARYVDLALSPRAPALEPPDVPFRAVLSEEVRAEDLAGCRVIIIAGLSRLDDAAAARVESFVRGGGGLLIFAGAATEPISLTERLHRGGSGILPARIEGREASPPEGLHPRDIMTAHPALSVFSDPEEGDLGRITVRRFRKASEIAADATVLARLSAERPWIIEKRSGRGTTILITTSAAPDDSDLPLTPLFVPLVHRIARYLAAPAPRSRSALAGEEISAPIDPDLGPVAAHVIDPAGTRHPASVQIEDGELRAAFRGTRLPGIHEIRIEREGARDAPALSRLFAVNIAPEESRLDRAGARALEDLRSVLGIEPAVEAVLLPPAQVREVPVEHWPGAVAAAVVCLLLELLIQRRMGGGKG